MANDSIEEFVEDMRHPILDLSQRSPRSKEDAKFSYNLDNIDWISDQLGVPWQLEKDQLWSSTITFIGFEWNLQSKTVGIGKAKKEKYQAAIAAWPQSLMHMLKEVQKLYSKLLHASLVVQEGRAYLTGLKCMLSIYHNAPFKPRTLPRAVPGDLAWWEETLQQPILVRPIPGPVPVVEIQAFSDASLGVGIGICIQDRWRAWKLIGNWKADKRDIGWAEAVGFEFLVQTILEAGASKQTFRVYGDNKEVVEGWANGHSRNHQVNGVFKRVHKLLGSANSTVIARYVASAENPADGPSRGIFPPERLLLPPIEIPGELQDFIVDFNSAEAIGVGEARQGQSKEPREKDRDARALRDIRLARQSEELTVAIWKFDADQVKFNELRIQSQQRLSQFALPEIQCYTA